jgi:hypothetical protein
MERKEKLQFQKQAKEIKELNSKMRDFLDKEDIVRALAMSRIDILEAFLDLLPTELQVKKGTKASLGRIVLPREDRRAREAKKAF